MKAVMISIRPKWVEKIASGEKTVEVRKTVPKCDVPFKVYIYQSKESKMRFYCDRSNSVMKGKAHHTDMGKVVGEFVVDELYNFVQLSLGFVFTDQELCALPMSDAYDMTCLTHEEIEKYLGGKDGYGLHISDLKIYDKPKELSEFHYPCHINNCVKCKYFNGFSGKLECHNEIAPPPRSWCYVEEL